jgi:hypothetical protein
MFRLSFASLSPGLWVASVAAAAVLAGCYKTPNPECAFACELGGAESCPDGYTCRADNLCKREDVPDSFSCPDTPVDAPVAIDAETDAPSIDAPTDAAEIDTAMIDAVDATVDAVDATVDAPVDAFAGLRITTTSPVDFGSTMMGTPVTRPVNVTNDGSATTTAITVTVTGTGYARVNDASDTCTDATLAMGATCTFNVTFDPQSVGGPLTGTAMVAASTGGNSSVNLTGMGSN